MDVDMDFLAGAAKFQQIDWGVVLDTLQCFDSTIAIDPTIDSLIDETLEHPIDWSAVFDEVNIQRLYSNNILSH